MRLLVLLGLALMVCGMLIFYYFGQTINIHCYRLTGSSVACSSQIYWFDLFAVAEPQLFAPVLYASSEVDCSSRASQADVCSSFLIFHHATSQSALDKRFFNQSSADRAADAINTFIADDTIFMDFYPSDKITLALTSCVGVPFFLLGALMLWGLWRGSGGLPMLFA